MNYNEFLNNLSISLDFSYFLTENDLKKVRVEDVEFLNNLFLAPNITLESRDKVFQEILDDKLDVNKKESIARRLKEIISQYDANTSDIKIKIREYAKYIVKCIPLDKIKSLIEQNENNLDFVFYVIFGKYNNSNYNDVIELINYINKNKIITKDNSYYNDILLYKLVSLKKIDNNYLKDDEKMFEICKIAEGLCGFDYTRLIAKLECCLVSRDLEMLRRVFDRNLEIFKKWDVSQLVNIFELITYCKDEELYRQTKELLISKDILLLDNMESNVFKFVESIKNNDNKNIEIYKELIKNDFNLMHYNYYTELLSE